MLKRKTKMCEFCEYLNEKNGFLENLKTPLLAEEFVTYFKIPPSPGFDQLIDLCDDLGINQFRLRALGGMSGYNECFLEDGYNIYCEKNHWIGKIRHTILHELYEVLEIEMHRYCRGFRRSAYFPLQRRANIFAACVLMPFAPFLNDILSEGFNILALQKKYQLAYGSIIIRMQSVVNGLTTFFGFIYEHRDLYKYDNLRELPAAPEDYIAKCVNKTKDIRSRSDTTGELYRMIPEQDTTIRLKSSVEKVLYSKKEKIFEQEMTPSLFDFATYIIKIQPVLWWGEFVSRIIVTGLGKTYQDDLRNHGYEVS